MTLEEYKRQLAAHDWYYGMSDDHRVYQRGAVEAERLAQLSHVSAEFTEAYREEARKYG